VLLDEDTAALDHVTAGTQVSVVDDHGRTRRLVVTGIADLGGARGADGASVLLLPAGTVAALTGADGYHRIDVAAAPGVSRSALAECLARLRLANASVVTGGQLTAVLAEQNAGGEGLLSDGLLIFALVSLLVAALVIYNAFRILLAQRLREVALLRCVGATRRQVMADILTESLVLGLTAGTAVTVGAALLPAMAASRTAPVAALTAPPDGTVRGRKTRVTVAVLLGAAGLALTAKGIPAGKTGLFLIAAGGAIFFLGFLAAGPLVAGPLAAVLGWLPSRLFGVPAAAVLRLAVRRRDGHRRDRAVRHGQHAVPVGPGTDQGVGAAARPRPHQAGTAADDQRRGGAARPDGRGRRRGVRCRLRLLFHSRPLCGARGPAGSGLRGWDSVPFCRARTGPG
jgi:putative ABC transport system permease protein